MTRCGQWLIPRTAATSPPARGLDGLAVLDRMGDASPETREVLTGPGLAHSETRVREEALSVLLRLAPDGLDVDTLVKLLQGEKSPKMRDIAERGLQRRLGELTRETLGPARTLLRLRDAERLTLLGLGVVQRLKGDAAELVPDVVPLLESQDEKVRLRALEALQAVGKPAAAAVPGLVKAFPTLPGSLRLPTALTLATLAPDDARVVAVVLPVLVAGLNPAEAGKDEPTRARAVQAIGGIGEPAVAPLFEALDKALGTGADLANYRKALLQALGAVGKPAYSAENVAYLRRFAGKERYPDVKEAAQRAIAAMSK